MNTINMIKVTIFVFAMFAMNMCYSRKLLGIPPDTVELCTSHDFAAAFQNYCFSIDKDKTIKRIYDVCPKFGKCLRNNVCAKSLLSTFCHNIDWSVMSNTVLTTESTTTVRKLNIAWGLAITNTFPYVSVAGTEQPKC